VSSLKSPRRKAAESVGEKHASARIVYVSCNPSSHGSDNRDSDHLPRLIERVD
jgi:hypothetical protein